MKKLLVLFFICLSLLFTACGRTMAEAKATTTPEATPTSEPFADPISFNEIVSSYAIEFEDSISSYDALYQFVSSLEEPENDICSASNLSFVAANEAYAYTLDEGTLTVLQLNGAETQEIAWVTAGIDWDISKNEEGFVVSAGEKIPVGLFLLDNTLMVVSDSYGYDATGEALIYDEYTVVDYYDVTDPYNPALISTFGQDGYLVDAGIGDSGLWVVTSYGIYDTENSTDTTTYVPRLYSVNGFVQLTESQIAIAKNGNYAGCSVIGFYSVGEEASVTAKAVAGLSGSVFISENGVLLTNDCHTEAPSREYTEGELLKTEMASCDLTELYLFNTTGSTMKSVYTSILGKLENEYAIEYSSDEFLITTDYNNEYLNSPEADPQNPSNGLHLNILDANLNEINVVDVSDSGDHSITLKSLSFGDNQVVFTTEDSTFKVTVKDADGKEITSKAFGADFSQAEKGIDGFYANPELNYIGFAADDSYCLYKLENNELVNAGQDVFSLDKAYNIVPVETENYLYFISGKDYQCIDVSALRPTPTPEPEVEEAVDSEEASVEETPESSEVIQ